MLIEHLTSSRMVCPWFMTDDFGDMLIVVGPPRGRVEFWNFVYFVSMDTHFYLSERWNAIEEH
jgi:hypothetical protein